MSLFAKVDWGDLLNRAAHTFGQAFIGVIGAWWIASGADAWNQVDDVASAKRFVLALFAAAIAAAASAVKTTLKAMSSTAGGIFETDDPEPDDVLPTGVYAGPITASQAKAAAAPSDPDQPAAGAPPQKAAARSHAHAKHESGS